MTSSITNHIGDHKATLTINGRFDFSIHRDFRANYEEILGSHAVSEIAVDLKSVEYVDSSALGMLLLLREKSMAENIKMRLINPTLAVRQVLEIANFEKLFSIT